MSALEHIRTHTANEASLEQLKRHVSVLHANLVGSTEFKRHHGEFDGLKKTLTHNATVVDVLEHFGAAIRKQVDDAVLGLFEGDSPERRAIQCGLAIVERIEAVNDEENWNHFPFKMATRVGVASGRVVEFPEDASPVVCGDVVDLASRICSLVGPQQVICTEPCFQAAIGQEDGTGEGIAHPLPDANSTCVTDVASRLVPGSNDPVQVRAIVPTGRTVGEILLSGHKRGIPDEVLPRLEQAQEAFSSGDSERLNEALEGFKEVVSDDPGNFEANFRAAQILLTRTHEPRRRRINTLRDVISYLSRAKQIRPDSCRAWHMAALTRHELFKLTFDRDELERAVKFSEIALQRAQELMDIDGVVLAKTCLARKLLERADDTEDETQSASDLTRARSLCEEVNLVVNQLHSKGRAEFLVTYAEVRLGNSETQNLEDIEDQINQAEKEDSQNQRLVQARERLQKVKRADSPSEFPL